MCRRRETEKERVLARESTLPTCSWKSPRAGQCLESHALPGKLRFSFMQFYVLARDHCLLTTTPLPSLARQIQVMEKQLAEFQEFCKLESP
jgi:hypothetical protein